MTSSIPMSLLKPTFDTPFHIDFEWWQDNEHDWHVHLQKCLCDEHQAYFSEHSGDKFIDYIDPDTAEVKQVDGLQHILAHHCAQQDDFITPSTQLVEAVFRALLANKNSPLTPRELEEITGKPARTILKTIAHHKIYMGIRPAEA
jgi:hypothetical protein